MYRLTEVEGLSLAYREAGRGAPVVFVHGALGSSIAWIHQLKAAENMGFRALALDLPGHSESQDLASQQLSIQDLARVVEGFMEALGLQTATLVGHSMGGAIALTIAVERPSLVEALVLVNTGAKLGVMKEILEGLERSYEDAVVNLIAPMAFPPTTPRELVEASVKEMLKTHPRVALRNFKACSTFDLRHRLGEVRAPTLVIAGSEDRLTPVKWSIYLNENIKGSRLKVIEGAGHLTMLERPREFNAELQGFISSVAQRS